MSNPQPETHLHPTKMIDVGQKAVTRREATAQGQIRMKPETAQMTQSATLPKGNALETARVAAIMAAKNTPQIIPLCHPLLLSGVDCEFECDLAAGIITATATVRCSGQTGVEMEALTAVSAALLTIYDMIKGVDETLEISHIVLLAKAGREVGGFRADSELVGPIKYPASGPSVGRAPYTRFCTELPVEGRCH